MKRYIVIAFVCLSTALLGARGPNGGGCATTSAPTVRQIELNVPRSVRTCAQWPKSPGKNATRRQVAAYLIRARSAWESCSGNNAAMERAISQWERQVYRLNRGRR